MRWWCLLLSVLLVASAHADLVGPPDDGLPRETAAQRVTEAMALADHWMELAQNLGDGRGMDVVPTPNIDLATLLEFSDDDRDALEGMLHPSMQDALARLVTAQRLGIGGEMLALLAYDLAPSLGLSLQSSDHEGQCFGQEGPREVLCFGTSGDDHLMGDDWYQFGGPGSIYIDPGGNDTYTITRPTASLGARALPTPEELLASDANDPLASPMASAARAGAAIFIDQGGDDTYHGQTNAFGSEGGLFMDLSGNDAYIDGDMVSGSTASQSFGANHGVFIDRAGDDTYLAHDRAFGYGGGWFIEEEGRDTYGPEKEDLLSSAFGSFDGGVFIERHGDDQYYGKSSSFGASGTFIDVRGDDSYVGLESNFATGVDGLFIEGDGNDTYELTQTGPNVRISFGYSGIFIELGGNDHFTTHKPGFGVNGGTFIDVRGDDFIQGADRSFGYGGFGGVFVDMEGDDVRIGGDDSFGFGGGLFFDGAGDDTYVAGRFSFGAGDGQTIADLGQDATIGRNMGFYDVGGEDTYDAGQLSFGTRHQGVFVDTEGSGDNNQVAIVAGEPTPMPEIESPFPAIFEVVDERSGARTLEAPEFMRPGATGMIEVLAWADFPFAVELVTEGRTTDDAGPFLEPVELTFDVSFHEQGVRYVRVAVVDALALHEHHRHLVGPIIVDGTAPDLVVKFDDGTGRTDMTRYYSVAGTLTASAQDSLSQVASIHFGVNEDVDFAEPSWEGDSTSASAVLDLSQLALEDGEHRVHVVALDHAGNAAHQNVTMRIDRAPPEVEVVLRNGVSGDNGWYTTAPEVIVDWHDLHAGLGFLFASWNGGQQSVHQQASQDVAQDFDDGVHVLRLDAGDLAVPGNWFVDEEAAIVMLDTTPPVTHVEVPQGTAPLPVTITADDETSGVASVEHRVYRNGSTPPAFTVGNSTTLGASGPWIVEHRATDMAGLTSQAIQTVVEVDPLPPTADFTAPTGPFSTFQNIAFTDHSTDPDAGIATWSWEFGNGVNSTQQNPNHAYQKSGTYNVTLTVTDLDGLTDTAHRDVIVLNQAPRVTIDAPTTFYAGQVVTFTADAEDPDGTVDEYQWRVNGAVEADTETLLYSFAAGNHIVELTVTDDEGASSTASLPLFVESKPPVMAEFSWTGSEVHETITFIDGSDPGLGTLTAWQWSMDGQTHEGPTASHSFTEAGTYKVSLTVTHEDGRTATVEHDVEILPLLPDALASGPAQALSQESLAFSDASTHPDHLRSIVAWHWDFGDGSTDARQHPDHAYATPGNYVVTLTVTDDRGHQAADSLDVTIGNQPPTLEVIEPAYVLGQAFTLTANAEDADGTIAKIEWLIDGNPFTGESATYTFNEPGTYAIHVSAHDDFGDEAGKSFQIVVEAIAPVADFTWSPESILSGETVTFSDASTDDGMIVAWAWSFGSTSQNPTNVFETPGTYEVTLEVTDNHGVKDSVTKSIVISNRAPTADFSHAVEGGMVSFTDKSSDPDGSIAKWSWDFGDSASTEAAPTRAFAPGTHTVKLTVTDDLGATATITKDITIANQAPTVAAPQPIDSKVGDSVSWEAIVEDDGTITNVTWDLGDGNKAYGQSVTHKYIEAGTYTITITASDDLSAQTSTTFTHIVEAAEADPQDDADEPESTDEPIQEAGKDTPTPFWLILAGLVFALHRRR